MSFRLPRGPKLLTLFHDVKSPSSQKVLTVLQNRLRVEHDQEQHAHEDQHRSRVKVYLEEAASNKIEREPLFELEIVERARATADQWKVIASYLNQSGGDGRNKIELKQSKIEALKDESGPIVVDWDDGLAVRTEEEVKELVEKLMKEDERKNGTGTNGCEIM